jgi:competence protein ComEC
MLLLNLPQLPELPWHWLLLPILGLIYFPKTRLTSGLLLGIVWAGYHAQHNLAERLPESLAGQDITITGQIADIPRYNDRSLRFLFLPDQSSNIDSLPEKLRLSWYRPFPETALRSGQRWQFTVRLKPPHGSINWQGFDYESWLFQQNIGATGYIRPKDEKQLLSSAPTYDINTLRHHIKQAIDNTLQDSPQRGLVHGLTIGLRDHISQDQWETLRLTGTSHLLAISGLHIGLVATLGFFLCRWLWSRRTKNLLHHPATTVGAIGSIIFAVFYAALAGFSLPSQRAMIMITTVAVAILLRHRFATRDIYGISLFLVVAYNPLSVLSAGFWLSFSAVGLIIYTLHHRFPSPKWPWARIHLLIAVGLTPLLLLFFSQTSLIAPLANLIAVPLVSVIIVPLLLLAICCLALLPPLGNILLHLADKLLSWLWLFLDQLAALPHAAWFSSPPAPIYWLSITLGMLLLLAPRGVPARYLGIIGLLPLWLISTTTPTAGSFNFTLLDVGQGLAAVIQTEHHTLIFDTGDKFSDQFNAGDAMVLPYLQAQGINKIDLLIISHADSDHSGGATAIKTQMTVTHTLHSPSDPSGSHFCQAGQSWQWDGVNFQILHPSAKSEGSDNNQSCVLKISAQGGSVLLTGDIEQAAEKTLLTRNRQHLASDILVVPHHGSKTSSSPDFIQQVNPQYVLFPTGYRNRFHHPAKQVVARYQHPNRTLLNTAETGAIQFSISENGIIPPLLARQDTGKLWLEIK